MKWYGTGNGMQTLCAGVCLLMLLSFGSARASEEEDMAGINVRITVGDRELQAVFQDNATTRSLIAKFPLTVRMMDLYGREMCIRFPGALPAREARTSGYEVGDIAYWTPRHSFVIFYAQNGEVISDLQKIGHISSGAALFARTGDTEVTFELVEKGERFGQQQTP